LPGIADRKTTGAIITHHCFQISHGTLQTWPLTLGWPNRASVYYVQEAMELAEKKLAASVSYKQAADH
jgi:hypothetical protein